MLYNSPNEAVQTLIGKKCWSVGYGELLACSIGLDFGARLRRLHPLRNTACSPEKREYDSEVGLILWCPWRLDGKTTPLASSDQHCDVFGKVLDELIGKTVIAAQAWPPAWDMRVRFDGDIELCVFCEYIPGDPSFDGNWDLAVRELIVSVGPGYKWELSDRVGIVLPLETDHGPLSLPGV